MMKISTHTSNLLDFHTQSFYQLRLRRDVLAKEAHPQAFEAEPSRITHPCQASSGSSLSSAFLCAGRASEASLLAKPQVRRHPAVEVLPTKARVSAGRQDLESRDVPRLPELGLPRAQPEARHRGHSLAPTRRLGSMSLYLS